MNKPTALVFAGPNGSGKSTISDNYPIKGIYVNADEIKRYRRCSDLDAAKEAEKIRESLLSSLKDFAFESVLSTERNLVLLEKAKMAGFNIESVFVLTVDVELNVKRVKARVLTGGHDVPEEKIRSRFNKSLKNLKKLVKICDKCIVVDNTDQPEIIYKKDAESEIYLSNDFWGESDIRGLID